MKRCNSCGASNEDDSLFCMECGASLQNQSTNSNSGTNMVRYYHDESVILSENEVKVKTYHCSTMRRPKGEGYVIVTNKRLIFHGYGSSLGGSSKLISEMPIETVTGINTYYGKGYNIILLILGILSGFISLRLLFMEHGESDYWLIGFIPFVAITALLLVKSIRTSYNLAVFSSGANGTPINLGRDGSFLIRQTGQGAAMTISAKPAKDAIEFMNEIGAIVLDFKSMGDHAINKWTNNVTTNNQHNSDNNTQRSVNSAPGSNNSNINDEEFFS